MGGVGEIMTIVYCIFISLSYLIYQTSHLKGTISSVVYVAVVFYLGLLSGTIGHLGPSAKGKTTTVNYSTLRA